MVSQIARLFTVLVQAVSIASGNVSALPAAPLAITPPVLDAASVFLIDTTEGKILAQTHADEVRPIASITKLMTAEVLLEHHPNWQDTLTVTSADDRRGDIDYLHPGEKISVHDAWNLMLIASSNDATALLVRSLFGGETQFVAAMNEKAHALGLKRTSFVDPTGLDPANSSTAREVAILTRWALHAPEIREAVLKDNIFFSPAGQERRLARATDLLLHSLHIPKAQLFGGKTGYIEESGYNLAFAAGKGGHELIGVVLGSTGNEGRFSAMQKLLQWGFSEARE